MGGVGSGGANRLPLELHKLRGTFKRYRHGHQEPAAPATRASASDRRRTLKGLTGEARRVASGLLDEFGNWDTSSLVTLRLYAESCARLAGPLTDGVRTRETRTCLALLRSLNLEK